jgi:hypothetical protein
MPYLNLDLDYFDHPKTVRLIGLLGRGADLLPIRLWCYCGKYHAENGELTGYSPEEIETAALKWWGQPGKAVEAMLRPFQGRPGFLEQTIGGYKVHDWEKINGHIAAFKHRAQAGAKAKWDKVRAEADAKAMLKHSLSNAASNALTSSLPEEEEKRKSKTKNILNLVDPGNLMPAKPDPESIPETRRRLQAAAKIDLLADPRAAFFDEARKSYPGTRGGLKSEWGNFQSKHGAEVEEILPLLAPAIQREKTHKAALKTAGLMVPQWKNFQTWINNRCWEQEFAEVEVSNGQNGSGWRGSKSSRGDQLDRDASELLREFGGAPAGNPQAYRPDVSVGRPGQAGA